MLRGESPDELYLRGLPANGHGARLARGRGVAALPLGCRGASLATDPQLDGRADRALLGELRGAVPGVLSSQACRSFSARAAPIPAVAGLPGLTFGWLHEANAALSVEPRAESRGTRDRDAVAAKLDEPRRPKRGEALVTVS